MKRIGVALVALIISCGGAQPAAEHPVAVEAEAPPPPPPFDPLAYLPAETFATVRIHVPRIVGSPYYSTVSGWLGRMGPEQLGRSEQLILDLLRRGDVLWAAIVPKRNQPDLGALLITGDYSMQLLSDAIGQLAEGETDLHAHEIMGHPAFGDDDAALVEIREDWWMVAPRETIDAILAQPARPAVFNEPAWATVENRLGIDDPAVRITGFASQSTHDIISRELPLPPAIASQVIAAAVGADVMDGITISSTFETNGPAAAQQLASWMQEQADEHLTGMAARMMGLGGVHESLSIVVDNQDVQARLTISDEDVRGLLNRVNMMMMMSGQGEGEAPQ